MGKSVWQTGVVSMTDSLLQWHKCQETGDTRKTTPCVFNAVATPHSYLNTNSF